MYTDDWTRHVEYSFPVGLEPDGGQPRLKPCIHIRVNVPTGTTHSVCRPQVFLSSLPKKRSTSEKILTQVQRLQIRDGNRTPLLELGPVVSSVLLESKLQTITVLESTFVRRSGDPVSRTPNTQMGGGWGVGIEPLL